MNVDIHKMNKMYYNKNGQGPILLELLPFVILNAFCSCIDSAYVGKSTCTAAFLKQSDTLLTQYRHIVAYTI